MNRNHWNDLTTIEINKEPAHCTYTPLPRHQHALEASPSPLVLSLDGDWQFHWAAKPADSPKNSISPNLMRRTGILPRCHQTGRWKATARPSIPTSNIPTASTKRTRQRLIKTTIQSVLTDARSPCQKTGTKSKFSCISRVSNQPVMCG